MCEILAPAGSKENLISAINAGADAVYLGLTDFSARKTAENFTLEDLEYYISYAKNFNVKVYVTVNTLIKEKEISKFLNAVNIAYSMGVDAFILQDVFLGDYLKKLMPEITLHLSTQAGVCNVFGARFAKKHGFSRVILARETTLKDIKEISKIIETEVFIQGALCTCFSGHCYMSSFIGGNSGNRGFCKQPCRKEYSINKNGKTLRKGYLISLSDLSVGDSIKTLIDAGVKSFKIEGRLRSKEYVYSSVRYYKELLNDNFDKDTFNALKVSFNRGDYTKGLAFGQEKNFISDKLQNNLGLYVGLIKNFNNYEIFLDNIGDFVVGDSFKIIRNGAEVGNATTINKNGKLSIVYKGNIKSGDYINLTKKVDLYNKLCKSDRKIDINVDVNIKVNEKFSFSIGDFKVYSDSEVLESKNAPISKNNVISCLEKTDIYPYNVNINFQNFDNNAFIPKSTLNKVRVKLYSTYFNRKNNRKPYNIGIYENNSIFKFNANNENCVIVSSLNDNFNDATDVVYAPFDYSEVEFLNKENLRVWLYLPPYFTSEDFNIIEKYIDKFYGVYTDGYYGIEYAIQNNLKFFVGTGINVFNKIDIEYLNKLGADRIAVSKELSYQEINDLNADIFVLSNGLVEIMDLIYCPLGKTCKNCDKFERFELIDNEGRAFPVKRYKVSDCRFKVYNMAILNENNKFNKIVDKSLKLSNLKTSGNYKKGVK